MRALKPIPLWVPIAFSIAMLVIFVFLVWIVPPARAQSDGVPPSPYWSAYKSAPLNRIKIRLGLPNIFRGPGYDIGDAPPTWIANGGSIEAFGSEQVSWQTSVTSMTAYSGLGGPSGSNTQTVTAAGPYPGTSNCPNTFKSNWTASISAGSIANAPGGDANDSCGDWVTSAIVYGSGSNALIVHNEGNSDYTNSTSTTNRSMSIFQLTSPTATPTPWVVGGLSNGTIISSTEAIGAGESTGFGDCTAIPDNTGLWFYMYCYFHSPSIVSNYLQAIARAPVSNPAPGQWTLLYHGAFQAPALNNPFNATTELPEADLFPPFGTYAATAPGLFNVMIVNPDHNILNFGLTTPAQQSINGLALTVSQDYIHFTYLTQPLIQYDIQDFFNPPRQYDLLLYPILRNDVNGSSKINTSHFDLDYTWIPPNNGFICRNVVVQPVTVTIEPQPSAVSGIPPVAVQLERYLNTSLSSRFRTSIYNPFPPMHQAGSGACDAVETGWASSLNLGYIETACPASANVNQCDATGQLIANSIEGCYATPGGAGLSDDYLLKINTNLSTPITGSCPTNYTHVRTEGYLRKAPTTVGITNPVYECHNTSTGYHWADNDATCGGQTVDGFLGYALAN